MGKPVTIEERIAGAVKRIINGDSDRGLMATAKLISREVGLEVLPTIEVLRQMELALREAVSDGSISQAQADHLLQS